MMSLILRGVKLRLPVVKAVVKAIVRIVEPVGYLKKFKF